MRSTPKVFNWIGNQSPVAYWDDASNWAEGEYPNQKEAIAVFSKTANQATKIILREDIHLAQMWFNEEHSLTFESDTSQDYYEEEDCPKLIFETSHQFSTLFIDKDNKADHVLAVRWINHSCCFLVPDRLRNGFPTPDINRPDEDDITTIHFDGMVRNYKDPERASLQVFGHLKVQLNASNTFKGPVVAANGGEVRVMVDGAIPNDNPIVIENGGKLFIEEGVTIKASQLRLDGKMLSPGAYFSDSYSSDEISALSSNEISGQQVANIFGKGILLIEN